jgi:hypothetical protein
MKERSSFYTGNENFFFPVRAIVTASHPNSLSYESMSFVKLKSSRKV